MFDISPMCSRTQKLPMTTMDMISTLLSANVRSQNSADAISAYIDEITQQPVESSREVHIPGQEDGKTRYEPAHLSENKTNVTKYLPFSWSGTTKDFENGIGTCCELSSSVDHNSGSVLTLVSSRVVAMQSTFHAPILVKIDGQTTNSEFFRAKIGSDVGQLSSSSSHSQISSFPGSFVIPGRTFSTIPISVELYARKSEIDYNSIAGWVGFKMEDLNKDILGYNDSTQTCFIAGTKEKPSRLAKVLMNAVNTGNYPEQLYFKACTFEEKPALLMAAKDVQWGISHILEAHKRAPVAALEGIKATITPQMGKWDQQYGDKALGASFGQDDYHTIQAHIENVYVVSNKNQKTATQ